MAEPPPIALYVHWPYCARICPYCDFNVYRARGREAEAAHLATAMLADLRAQAGRLGPRRLVSIHFGGGTPSLADPAFIAAVVDEAAALFSPAHDLEIALEANPTDAESGRYADFAAAGVNRLSLGVQSLDDGALRFLGRDHEAAEARRAADLARQRFARLSIDLIYALPGQRLKAWRDELCWAADLGAEHISPYQLTIEARTAFGRAAARGVLRPPGGRRGAALYELTQSVLGEAGFEAYEVSNHARGEAARSRHNLSVWRGADYLGIGPGAHGRLTLEGVRRATLGAPRVDDYLAAVAERGDGLERDAALDAREDAEERLMLALRLAEGAPAGLFAALGLSADADPLRWLLADGLLEQCGGRVAATPAGRPVLDAVLAALLARP
ncbi:radical SAM family heme chaperone HemW [Brevundimonas sp. 2R-24]|uniref:Heme chaperone HemW n=1 Tax=Peiella sedimenti TaxID=3061083 RepID=A0ABT8SNI4_9CAUL|nr:radical SAM family heme chaperone HemW [Caulobacteraceae bacterium XZ-24]